MAQVILTATAVLALILLHTAVLARQGVMFSTGSDSNSTSAMPVEDGANNHSSQAKQPDQSVGLRRVPISPPQSLGMKSPHKRQDAAEEIVNLLHKDYFHKPSGKPPIHNRFTRH